ncbi:MAG: chemotaxis signal relay system histidine kinase CheA [Rhodobacteraceae bacterium HLUCCA08]|nr:MAG: chemotaxis signal relay system histidine kinase CheA [Rhodobacteraceae bacterium HLUCCA08]
MGADQMSMQDIRDTFFQECEDLLEAMNEGLGVMDAGEWDADTVNAVFRAVHSIKGGAGAFGLADLVAFAHTFETVFDEVRADRLPVTPDLVQVFLRAGDQLANLVEAARDEVQADPGPVDAALTALEAFLEGDTAAPAEPDAPAFEPAPLSFEPMGLELDLEAGPPAPLDETFVIRFRPMRALVDNGHEPLRLLSALAALGDTQVTVDLDDLPAFERLDPEEAYLAWTIVLTTPRGRPAIDEVFEFVEGLCTLEIEANDAAPAPEVTSDQVAFSSQRAAAPAAPAPEQSAPPPDPEPGPAAATAAAAPAPAAPKAPAPARPTLRVELDRVDRLINTVGELIINQAMLSQRVAELDLPSGADIEVELEDYKHLAREIQEGVMAIRAQPVKPLFQRMARIVREACGATGKTARLVTVGENTEVDKTVIESLSDPLTHIIRNAVDHGLEPADRRAAAGKPAEGVIRLAAAQRSGSIFIEVSDDGGGLNRPRIYDIAVSKGLIPAGAELTDTEIDNLLFLPGFSTADQVSNLSGRGVGMDVVRTAIQGLGGRILIASEPGRGTTMTIVLPLTLAVMDGMVVSVAEQTMVVPIAPVQETIRPTDGDIHILGAGDFVLQVRGRFIPIVDVAACLGAAAATHAMKDKVLILVETEQRGLVAMALDAIHDQRQVVIKSLEGSYGTIPGISAATILGDGKIALILDPDGIAQLGNAGSDPLVPTPQLQEALHG